MVGGQGGLVSKLEWGALYNFFQYEFSCLPRSKQISDFLALYEQIVLLIEPFALAQYSTCQKAILLSLKSDMIDGIF